MSKSVSEKLKIKQGYSLLTIGAPGTFKKSLGVLPTGVQIFDNIKAMDQVHWFVMNKKQLEKEMSQVMKLLKPGITVWVYYPKGSSKIQTDLTRDKGWDCLLKEKDKLTWISLISFDDTWSVFGFRPKNEDDKKKEAKPDTEREIFKWVNPKTKEVSLPDDLAAALKKNKKESDIFHALAYSHKKEYVEWIVTAKKEQTRKDRIAKSVQMLGKGSKNPSDV